MKTIKLMLILALGVGLVSCKKEVQKKNSNPKQNEQELAMKRARSNFKQSKWMLEKASIMQPKNDYYVQRSLNFKLLILELKNDQEASITINNQKLVGLYNYAITYNFSEVNPNTYFNYQFTIPKDGNLTDDETKYLTNVAGTVTYSNDGKYFSLTNDYFKTDLLFKRIN